FYTTSGNPELHSGGRSSWPCGAALGVPAALTLSFIPTMCPQQRPRPSPPADAGIRLLCSGPRDVGTYGRRRLRRREKNLKNIFFFFFFNFKYALSCALPAFCLFFL
ncbi:unnamed protein product, partial [Staurois parvus]